MTALSPTAFHDALSSKKQGWRISWMGMLSARISITVSRLPESFVFVPHAETKARISAQKAQDRYRFILHYFTLLILFFGKGSFSTLEKKPFPEVTQTQPTTLPIICWQVPINPLSSHGASNVSNEQRYPGIGSPFPPRIRFISASFISWAPCRLSFVSFFMIK